MIEPRWLTIDEVRIAHERQLVRFGGPAGIRDKGTLESALMRPVNRWHYGERYMPALAAAYGFELARTHAFVDGNKGVTFSAILLFLRLNGIGFAPDQPAATTIIRGLAAGEVDEDGLTRWIRDNLPEPLPGS